MGTNLKVAVISYHKNLKTLYPRNWIRKYRESIERQSFKSFDIFELNYGGSTERIFPTSNFESIPFPTFVHGMNYLIDKCFSAGYDVVFNTNVDDYYSQDRFAKQLSYINQGYDLVSSNFALVKDDRVDYYHHFENANIKAEFDKNHNIIAHPVVAYSKKFWENNRYNPDEIPAEDFYLWIRAISQGLKFIILPDNLLYQRVHTNSVCRSQNR